MACSCAGMVALLVLFAAAALNIVSFILPMWTTSSVVNASLADELTSADFAAGLWGFCTDVELKSGASSANETLTFDHCYFFHTSSKYDLTEIDDTFMSNFSDYSVCDGYKESQDAGDEVLLVYTSVLAYVAGMNGTSFGSFLDKSCGGLGSASLVLGAISMSAGVLAFTFLTLGITCCKSKSFFVVVGRILVVVAFFATLLTFILWLPQSHMLGDEDDVTLNGSFVISVIAAALYLVGLGLVARHAAIGK